MTDLLSEAIGDISFDVLEDLIANIDPDINDLNGSFIEDFLQGVYDEEQFVYNGEDQAVIPKTEPMVFDVSIVKTEPTQAPEPKQISKKEKKLKERKKDKLVTKKGTIIKSGPFPNRLPFIIPEMIIEIELPVESQSEIFMSSIIITKQYYCEPCDKTFQKSGPYIQHCNFHHSEKSHRCIRCGKRYQTIEILKNHMKNHEEKAQTFLCTQCPKKFVHNVDLKRHKMKHFDDRPFYCPECTKGFVRRDHLLQHQRCHQRKIERKILKELNKARKC
ncbi:unnamed protein product [Diamesa tonsa]